MTKVELETKAKKLVWDYWKAACPGVHDWEGQIISSLSSDSFWQGPDPIEEFKGASNIINGFYRPLFQSFPDIQKEPYILMSGEFEKELWVSGTGHFKGTFEKDWLGIPASGKNTTIRFGEFCKIENNKITASYIILDIPDVMRQAGYDVLAPNIGSDGFARGPAAGDGILLDEQDPEAGETTIKLVWDMIVGLGEYDGSGNLDSMGQERFWDEDNMIWYGPHGIGTTYGLKGFQDFHQRPYLESFPDRKGGHHVCRHGDGLYAASTGWPSVIGNFTGKKYKDLEPTGKRFTMRVMDWWRREDNKLLENWVFLDLIAFYREAGVDLFQRMQAMKKRGI